MYMLGLGVLLFYTSLLTFKLTEIKWAFVRNTCEKIYLGVKTFFGYLQVGIFNMKCFLFFLVVCLETIYFEANCMTTINSILFALRLLSRRACSRGVPQKMCYHEKGGGFVWLAAGRCVLAFSLSKNV